jgi:histidine triad (HIT) family protein
MAGAAKERTSRVHTHWPAVSGSGRACYGTILSTYSRIALYMSTIFTKIINREIPGQFVYEDDVCVVLMDKFPGVPGQTLVVPKLEVDYLFDLPDDIYQHLFSVAKKIAKASDVAYGTIRTCLVVEGFEVPHVHIKLYPMTSTDKKLNTVIVKSQEESDETLEAHVAKLRAELTT